MAEIVEEERHSADELRFLRKRIVLIAMDGSKHSEYAFRSSALVGASDNSVHALYHAHAEEMKQVFRHIEELAKRYKVTHRIEHLHGLPGASIVKAAAEQKAGMIICGSRGRGLIRRTILGSVSDYVLHHAHVPVIVCKHEDEQKKLKTERQISQTSTVSNKSVISNKSSSSYKSACSTISSNSTKSSKSNKSH